MIVIKNILLFYYDFLNTDYIKYDEKNNIFEYNNSKYMFVKVHKINPSILNILKNIPNFHLIINNKFNNIISEYYNEKYALLKISNIKNEKNTITDIIDFSNINIKQNVQKKDYFLLWKNKIDFLEKYYKDYYSRDGYDFYYFYGLSMISLNIMKKINSMNITYGLSFNRFKDINTLYDLYNPFNVEYGPIVDSVSEFIKNEFFFNNKKIDYKEIFNLNLNEEDLYYLISRLLFPSYYFDLYKNNEIKNKYNIIQNLIEEYIAYIKEIFEEIKKRHQMPFIDYIINLL